MIYALYYIIETTFYDVHLVSRVYTLLMVYQRSLFPSLYLCLSVSLSLSNSERLQQYCGRMYNSATPYGDDILSLRNLNDPKKACHGRQWRGI